VLFAGNVQRGGTGLSRGFPGLAVARVEAQGVASISQNKVANLGVGWADLDESAGLTISVAPNVREGGGWLKPCFPDGHTGGRVQMRENYINDRLGPRLSIIHPSGRYFYTVNWDRNSLSVYEVHPETGALRMLTDEDLRKYVVGDKVGEEVVVSARAAKIVQAGHKELRRRKNRRRVANASRARNRK